MTRIQDPFRMFILNQLSETMTRTTTLLPLSLTAMLALGLNASAQDRTTFGEPRHAFRNAASRPQPSMALRGTTPANDECANAETIALVTLDACASGATPGNSGGSDTSSFVPSCDGSTLGLQDVWYTFNSGSASAVYITLTPGEGMTDFGLAVFDGCEGTELACEVVPDAAVSVAVDPATEYTIQIFSNLDWGTGGAFTLCVAYDNAPAPANDNCSSVTPEALAIGNTITFTGTTAGATIDGDFVDPTDRVAAVWHGITLSTCATLTVDFCGTDPAFTNGYGIIGTDCPLDDASLITFTTANNTSCGDDNYTITYLNVPAGTYYLPVWSQVGVAYGPYTMHVAATACSVAPANDDCTGAIAMTPTTTCTPVAGTTLLATESMPAEVCSEWTGTADDDVWYSFVASNTSHTIAVTTPFDGVLALYRSDCGALQGITCIDDVAGGGEETITVDTLTVGNTYYYRLYSYSAAASADPTFTTCVTGPEGTGLNEMARNANWSLYPNPSKGTLNIRYDGAFEQVRIEVLDLSGRMIHEEVRYMGNGQSLTLRPNSHLATGAYNVRLTNSVGRTTQRVVVE